MKCYEMLKNSRVTAFTVSGLSRENQQGVKIPTPPSRLGLKALFVIYANFECVSVPSTDNDVEFVKKSLCKGETITVIVTGKYRESAHQNCKLNLILTEKNLFCVS